MICFKCKAEFDSAHGDVDSGIDCTECEYWFCDNCYDTDKGDGCHCHCQHSREVIQLAIRELAGSAKFSTLMAIPGVWKAVVKHYSQEAIDWLDESPPEEKS